MSTSTSASDVLTLVERVPAICRDFDSGMDPSPGSAIAEAVHVDGGRGCARGHPIVGPPVCVTAQIATIGTTSPVSGGCDPRDRGAAPAGRR